MHQKLENIYTNADADALHLLTSLLQFDPNRRISAAAALDHKYFKPLLEQGYLEDYEGSALHPTRPLNVDIEKIAESSDHLRNNVSSTVEI